MILYDDRTKGVLKSGNKFVINNIRTDDEIIFKASYIVTTDLKVDGKITALFDLIVLGDVSATVLDVKGRFVCLGKCTIKSEMFVRNDILVGEIQGEDIICHERIVAQEASVRTMTADGSIIVAKTLSVDELVKSPQIVMCGETAYGSGKIAANTIITAEPLDLDDGEDALESPFSFKPESGKMYNSELQKASTKYAKTNDYVEFLKLLQLTPDPVQKAMFSRYEKVLKEVEKAFPTNIADFRDVAILIWMMEIINSEYFNGWSILQDWLKAVKIHFDNMIHGRLSEESELKPARKLMKGYVVSHKKYGKGIVNGITRTMSSGKISQSATIVFDEYGEKKFPIPASLKYFMIISEVSEISCDEIKASIQCTIDSYSEWLNALMLIDNFKEFLGSDLHDVIYELLMAKIGLKAKFVEDRIRAKGWK